MEKTFGVHKVQTLLKNSIVTIGNFDGVHVGHREIIAKVVSKAKAVGGVSVVVTFHPHPRKVLFPESELKMLFPLDDQEKMFRDLGVDVWIQQPFSRDISQLHAEDFFRDWILKPLSTQSLIVGYDFAFGANREGSLSLLETLCKTYRVDLEIVPAVRILQSIVSSTEIRKNLKAGNMNLVNQMLGRHFYISGIVEKGDQRGRTIGFPTANILTQFESIPQNGVYSSQTKVRGKDFFSVTNIGYQPTIDRKDKTLKIETHILNFNEEIYGEEVQVFFNSRIRDEKKFENLEALKEQIQLDVLQAQRR